MRPHTDSDLIAGRCAELRNDGADLRRRVNELSPPTETDEALNESAERCTAELTNTAEIAVVMLLNVLFRARTTACRELRFFQITNRIRHSAANPMVTNTLLIITPLFCLEGMGMGLTMMSAGDMNPIPALGYGLIFSAINVALAVSAGFFCTRYLTYRLHNKYADEHDAKIRNLARSGLAAHLGLLLLLIFSTLRVRATGHHDGIFNFAEVGFLATFDNGFTLAILGISFLSTIIGVYEGRHGFSDIVPGYTQVQRRAEVLIDEQAGDLVDHSFDSLADQLEASIEDLEMRVEDRDFMLSSYNSEINALHAGFVEFNNAVLSAKDESRVFAEEQSEIDALPPRISRLDAFDALLLCTQMLPSVLKEENRLGSDALIARISRAHDQASAQIMAAHAEYLTRKPEPEFPEQRKGNGYGESPTHDTALGGSAHV